VSCLWSHGWCCVGQQEGGYFLIPVSLVCWNNLPQVYLHCFNVSFHHAKCGCRGVVCIVQIPRLCNTSCRSHDLKFQLWLPYVSVRTPKQQKRFISRASIIVNASWVEKI
jgi:hypothetical protein